VEIDESGWSRELAFDGWCTFLLTLFPAPSERTADNPFSVAACQPTDWVDRLRLWTGESSFLLLTVHSSDILPSPSPDENMSDTGEHEQADTVPTSSSNVLTTPSITASQAKLLLSSFCIAAGNVGFKSALFIQCGMSWKELYAGFKVDGEHEWRFGTHHIPYVPRSFDHEPGILDLFQELTAFVTDVPSKPTTQVASRFLYRLDQFDDDAWRQSKDTGSYTVLSSNIVAHYYVYDPSFL
jgi:hypothetical protein